MKLLFAMCMAAVAVWLGGCGGAQEQLQKDTVAMLSETCDVLESITDENTARAAIPALKKLKARADLLKKRARELGKPTPRTSRELAAAYGKEMRRHTARIEAATQRIRGLPDVMKILKNELPGSSSPAVKQ